MKGLAGREVVDGEVQGGAGEGYDSEFRTGRGDDGLSEGEAGARLGVERDVGDEFGIAEGYAGKEKGSILTGVATDDQPW